MAIVDPNSKELDRKPRYHVRAGKKVFKVVVSTRQDINDKQQVRVHCLVVKDLDRDNPKEDPPNDLLMACDARLWNTERGAAAMGRMARALKFLEPFDTDNDVDWLNKVMTSNSGVFVGLIKLDNYVGRDNKPHTSAEIAEFFPYDGEIDPAWEAQADAQFSKWEKDRAAAEEKRAKYASQGGGGRGAGGYQQRDGDPF